MAKLTDIQIKVWIKKGEHFEGRSDGDGLVLCYRKEMSSPMWRFRYRFAGKQRQMFIGSYKNLSLADARKKIKELTAQVIMGHDVAAEKQVRKVTAIAQIEAEKSRLTVAMLADQYYQERVLKRSLKKPEQILGHLNRLKLALGKMPVEDVTGKHIKDMYQQDLARGFPVSTNKLRQHTRYVFNFAVAQNILSNNPAQLLDISYAGGKQEPRKRNLSCEELMKLFAEMAGTKGFGRSNYLTVKLLLMLCVRKSELIKARKSEFDLDNAVWTLAEQRTKTNEGIDIPLSKQAVEALTELFTMSDSDYLLPARNLQHKKLPHISEATINMAFKKIKTVHNFTVHDLRRTGKTALQLLGIDEFISERCLNHKISGVSGTYGKHSFFEERKKALQLLANYLESCENGTNWNVTPIRKVV